jgi:hypothetical protein
MKLLNYFLFCEDVTTDESGKTTIVGIFDTIAVSKVPTPVNVFKIAFSFMADETDISNGVIQIKVIVINPEGKQKGVLEVEAQPKDSSKSILSTLASSLDIGNDLVINITGTYDFKFYVNNTLVITRPLHVIPTKGAKK